MGARGLKSVVDQPMVDLMFELPSLVAVRDLTVGDEFFSDSHEVIAMKTDGTIERIPLLESA